MARLQETIIAFGRAKQSAIATAPTAPDYWRLLKVNPVLANPKFITEDDAAFLGKGHEFATTLTKSHIESGPHVLEKYLSSEFAAWLWTFGLGKMVKTGAGPFVYTCTPMDPVTDGVELPYFGYIEQIRPGGTDVRDIALVGCAVSSFRITTSSGPGRENSKCSVSFVHAGTIVDPSTITAPAATAENLLNAYSLACTINGTDYIAAPTKFISLERGFDNNFLGGFFPGSGQQNGYQIQGRLEVGVRTPVFIFKARFVDGSDELTKVRDLTTGTAVVNLTLDSSNKVIETWQKLAFSVAEVDNQDGTVSVSVTGKPLYHATNGLVSVAVTTTVNNIGGAAA